MAHPCDYASQSDISRLRKSNPNPGRAPESNGNLIMRSFLRENPNWAIDSLVTYALREFKDYGISRKIIADEIKFYVMNGE